MSEEEIIKYIKDEIENEIDTFHWFDNTPKNQTRKQIEESIKAHQGLLDLYNKEKLNNLSLSEQLNKEKEKNKVLEIRANELNNLAEIVQRDYIHKDKIKEILGIEEDVSDEAILSLIETIVDENNRLEDIEDRKVQIEYNNVFNKGVKSVEDKIKEKIKYIKENYSEFTECSVHKSIEFLEELLKGE